MSTTTKKLLQYTRVTFFAVLVALATLLVIDFVTGEDTGGDFVVYENAPEYLKLKSIPEDVLYAEVYETEQGGEVKYAYMAEEVPPGEGEALARRTPNSQTEVLAVEQKGNEKIETLRTTFFSSPQFYEDNGRWRQIEYATTTPEIFAASGAIKYVQRREWWERLLPGKPVFAQTSTFRPDANTETNSVDGAIFSEVTNQTGSVFAACSSAVSSGSRTAADSATVLSTRVTYSTTDNPPLGIDDFGEDRYDCTVVRSFFTFDTAGLPDGAVIDSATLSVYVQSKYGSFSEIGVVTANPASNTAISTADWTTVGGTFISATSSNTTLSASGYHDFTFNPTGEAYINLTGVTETAIRLSSIDEDGQFGTQSDGANFSSADTSGTSQDPELEVVYTANTFSFGQWFPF